MSPSPAQASSNDTEVSRNPSTGTANNSPAVTPKSQQNPPSQSINEYFGSSSGTEVPICELQKLPADSTKELIQAISQREQFYLENITKKLSNTILENQSSYDKELQRVRDLQRALMDAYIICQNGRAQMNYFQSDQALKLLVQHQHLRNLLHLQYSLNTIKTLEYTDVRLMELMKEEKYPDAIQLCMECRRASAAYGHYNCIKDLSVKMQDTLDQIEEQIDHALSQVCDNYDESIYEKLQSSYKLLGKNQTAIDQLLMHFTSCVHKTAFQTLLHHASTKSDDKATLQKKTFGDICQFIDLDIFIPCLVSLCRSLSNVLWCYQKVYFWHRNKQIKELDSPVSEADHSYILQKLVKGKQRVWMDVQSKVKVLLISADMANLEYEQFLKIIDVTNILVKIGEKLCGKSSDGDVNNIQFSTDLQNPIYDLSMQYFRAYHKKCTDELHMFLANEAWETCPVQEDFNVLQMPEFKPYHAANQREMIGRSNKFERQNDSAEDQIDQPFTKLFDISLEYKSEAEMLHSLHLSNDDDTASPDEFSTGPILTNSALNVLRICGKYLSMCEVLEAVATEVVVCMSKLFDYYWITVYQIFAQDCSHHMKLTDKLLTTLQRISSELIQHKPNGASAGLPLPTISSLLQITGRDALSGFHNRIIAAESLINLAEQFKVLRPNLEKVLKASDAVFLQQFFAQTVNACNEVRSLVYYPVAASGLDYGTIVKEIPNVNWAVTEIMSQHNKYVDDILVQCKVFESKLLSMLSGRQNCEDIMRIIWKYCAVLCNSAFVDGYSCVKKCSNEGRALMQLDYQQFISKLEELSRLSPAPNKSFVENYLKAFYLSEDDFDSWKEKHPEYSEKQLQSLLSCIALAASRSKRSKVRNILEMKKK